jgi:hypothetical protein
MFETIQCAHDLCNCVLTAEVESEKYCSDACRDAVENGIESETCQCGHPPCDTP